jgi:cytochrome c5
MSDSMPDTSPADTSFTPKQLCGAVLALLVVIMAGLASAVFFNPDVSSWTDASAIDQRLQRVGTVVMTSDSAASSAPQAAAAPAADPGKALFGKVCTACHTAGVAGAPKFGDKAAWAPRIAKGLDALHHSALTGFNAMPARGGSSASDDDVKAAVDYMVHAAQ